MPVHILFLQLIIDPACSVVFEAEPLEADAMRAPPRRPDARLFDGALLVRGLWQGGGLLVLLLGVYGGARAAAASDEVARALTFFVLVLANLGLIQVNRSWGRTAWRGAAAYSSQLRAIAAAALALLAIALGVPAIRRLFAFGAPPPAMLLAGAGVFLVSLLWFEAVKRAGAETRA